MLTVYRVIAIAALKTQPFQVLWKKNTSVKETLQILLWWSIALITYNFNVGLRHKFFLQRLRDNF